MIFFRFRRVPKCTLKTRGLLGKVEIFCMAEEVKIQEAGLEDQGELGELLIECVAPLLKDEYAAVVQAGGEAVDLEDELLAADDFYFSSVDLMNCCYFAKVGGKIIGAAAVNPYTSELQYLVVRPDYRRRGLGRKLLRAALGELRRRGCGHVKIDLPATAATPETLAFFAAMEFTEIRRQVRLGRSVPQSK